MLCCVHFLQSAPWSQIRTLGLRNSNLRDRHCEFIAQACPNLTQLDLTGNKAITASGVEQLGRRLLHCRYLGLDIDRQEGGRFILMDFSKILQDEQVFPSLVAIAVGVRAAALELLGCIVHPQFRGWCAGVRAVRAHMQLWNTLEENQMEKWHS